MTSTLARRRTRLMRASRAYNGALAKFRESAPAVRALAARAVESELLNLERAALSFGRYAIEMDRIYRSHHPARARKPIKGADK